eukprot:765165-Hanusia_phi.AAC.1
MEVHLPNFTIAAEANMQLTGSDGSVLNATAVGGGGGVTLRLGVSGGSRVRAYRRVEVTVPPSARIVLPYLGIAKDEKGLMFVLRTVGQTRQVRLDHPALGGFLKLPTIRFLHPVAGEVSGIEVSFTPAIDVSKDDTVRVLLPGFESSRAVKGFWASDGQKYLPGLWSLNCPAQTITVFPGEAGFKAGEEVTVTVPLEAGIHIPALGIRSNSTAYRVSFDSYICPVADFPFRPPFPIGFFHNFTVDFAPRVAGREAVMVAAFRPEMGLYSGDTVGLILANFTRADTSGCIVTLSQPPGVTGLANWTANSSTLTIEMIGTVPAGQPLTITIPSSSGLMLPREGLDPEALPIKMESTAVAGPILPTVVHQFPAVGSLLDSMLSFSNTSNGNLGLESVYLLFSRPLSAGDSVIVYLPTVNFRCNASCSLEGSLFAVMWLPASQQLKLILKNSNAELHNYTILLGNSFEVTTSSQSIDFTNFQIKTLSAYNPIEMSYIKQVKGLSPFRSIPKVQFTQHPGLLTSMQLDFYLDRPLQGNESFVMTLNGFHIYSTSYRFSIPHSNGLWFNCTVEESIESVKIFILPCCDIQEGTYLNLSFSNHIQFLSPDINTYGGVPIVLSMVNGDYHYNIACRVFPIGSFFDAPSATFFPAIAGATSHISLSFSTKIIIGNHETIVVSLGVLKPLKAFSWKQISAQVFSSMNEGPMSGEIVAASNAECDSKLYISLSNDISPGQGVQLQNVSIYIAIPNEGVKSSEVITIAYNGMTAKSLNVVRFDPIGSFSDSLALRVQLSVSGTPPTLTLSFIPQMDMTAGDELSLKANLQGTRDHSCIAIFGQRYLGSKKDFPYFRGLWNASTQTLLFTLGSTIPALSLVELIVPSYVDAYSQPFYTTQGDLTGSTLSAQVKAGSVLSRKFSKLVIEDPHSSLTFDIPCQTMNNSVTFAITLASNLSRNDYIRIHLPMLYSKQDIVSLDVFAPGDLNPNVTWSEDTHVLTISLGRNVSAFEACHFSFDSLGRNLSYVGSSAVRIEVTTNEGIVQFSQTVFDIEICDEFWFVSPFVKFFPAVPGHTAQIIISNRMRYDIYPGANFSVKFKQFRHPMNGCNDSLYSVSYSRLNSTSEIMINNDIYLNCSEEDGLIVNFRLMNEAVITKDHTIFLTVPPSLGITLPDLGINPLSPDIFVKAELRVPEHVIMESVNVTGNVNGTTNITSNISWTPSNSSMNASNATNGSALQTAMTNFRFIKSDFVPCFAQQVGAMLNSSMSFDSPIAGHFANIKLTFDFNFELKHYDTITLSLPLFDSVTEANFTEVESSTGLQLLMSRVLCSDTKLLNVTLLMQSSCSANCQLSFDIPSSFGILVPYRGLVHPKPSFPVHVTAQSIIATQGKLSRVQSVGFFDRSQLTFSYPKADEVTEIILSVSAVMDLADGEFLVLTLPGFKLYPPLENVSTPRNVTCRTECLLGTYSTHCTWLEASNGLKISISECGAYSKGGLNFTFPLEANIVIPSVGIPYNEKSITIETNAVAGPVLPTPVQLVPPIGSFLDSSRLAFDQNATAGEVSSLVLTFRASMSIFIGELVTLHLPGFKQELPVPVVMSSGEFSAASWQSSSESLVLTAGRNITAGTPCNVTVFHDARIQLPVDGVR